ncbi:probable G-protein coupled receptor 45 [Ornithorhynchus anatinus]|uniref:G protein-coupled receptor 45 n=1 Tax=Ornithorhynchus anatinus TaxID=9258 RepID=A0A6I8NL91_ORNAN|nr:probable G-protein coupled receptor 45 [Ornithorhynchus anatinus]
MACNSTFLETHASFPLNGSTPPPDFGSSTLPAPLRIPMAIIMLVMIAVGFLGNAIVCLLVYQKPAMRSAINLLLGTLAFSDILLSLFCLPFTAITLITGTWNFGAPYCRISATLFWFFVLEGVAILLIISVDRFLIIVQHQDRLTPRRAKVLIAGSWALSFCISFPSLAGWAFVEVPARAPQCVLGYTELPANRAYAVTLVTAVFFVPFGIMLYTYLCILNTVRRNVVRIHHHHPLSRHAPDGLHLGPASPTGLRRSRRTAVDVSFKTRAFMTILILFVGFSLCWLPHTVFSLLSVFSQRFYYGSSFYATGTYMLGLSYLKSVFNPVIYCWRIKKFREACVEFLPNTFRISPRVPGRTKRRIHPSTIYVCGEHQSAV